MELERVKEKALEKYYPGQEELDQAQQIFGRISGVIREKYGLEAHFAGSAARETCRKGDKDIDVFVLFPEDTSRQELEEEGLKIGRYVFDEFDGEHHVEYAEHPYTKGEILGHEVEIVPCIDTAPDSIRSSVDRTPHHTRWVKQNLDKQQRKDVVALKAFLEAQGLYGSSLKTRGFSGYLCEILVAYYGSFEELIDAAKSWNREKRIEFNNSDKEFESDFVVVDPVDSDRNVAAVLSPENYARFIFEAWSLYRNSGVSKFSKHDEFDEFVLKQEIDDRGDMIVLEFERPEEVDDIIYPQLRKLKRLLEKKLVKSDFRVYESGVHADQKCRIFFEVERDLPNVEIVKGPEVFHNEKHLDQFDSKYSNTFVEEQRLCAKIPREVTDAQNFVKNFVDGGASELREKGVPAQLSPHVEESKFADPMEGDREWLKYLYRKFNCVNQR